MPLTTCPDCYKQVSDRVEACPFCGCPAKFFSIPNEKNSLSIQKEEDSKSTNAEDKEYSIKENEESITFFFGTSRVEYPKKTENIAKLYGKYVSYSMKYYEKYYESYYCARSMHSVLTDLSMDVMIDIKEIVEEACKELYSFGIKITSEDFIEKYDINFLSEIESLYNQYEDIKQEKEEIAYKREVQKASRGRWQGGGFGMKGAIQGAVNAAVLNAGSGLIHSIGDGITKSGDNRYINNKLDAIYYSDENGKIFAEGVYRCIDYILEGIKKEMSGAGLIDIDVFGTYKDVESDYEIVVKYEKNKKKMLEGMVQCFSRVPEMERYYEPVIKELFEKDSDVEKFLAFWGLTNVFHSLEQKYINTIMESINNPFVRNVADIGIEIRGILDKQENGIILKGKVIKGSVNIGTSITVLKEGFYAGISTVISSICEEGKEVTIAKVGKVYEFRLLTKKESMFSKGTLLVNSSSFEKVEADLYARYYESGEKIIWGFDDYSVGYGKSVIFNFNSKDRYTSCRGVDFTFDASKVMDIYGTTVSREFDNNNDVALRCAKDYGWKDVIDALEVAAYNLSYPLNEEYTIRFYFNKNDKMLLVVYLKNVDVSNEFEYCENSVVVPKIKLEMECLKCGRIFKDDMKFCNYCGEPNPRFVKKCPKCEKQIKKESKFCNFCGEQFV